MHGPGCPVCVIPMGRVDDAIALAERPEVIFTTFGDMMRVPGGRGSLLEAKARGADVRMVYSPLDALELARARTRSARSSSSRSASRRPRRRPRSRCCGPRAEGIRNFSVFCNHVTIGPPLRAILDSPGPAARRASSRPGHVSTVIGTRAVPTSSPTSTASRSSSPAFEPLDILAGDAMLLRQLARGPLRGREPVHAGRPAATATRARSRRSTRRWSCARRSSGAGSAGSRGARCRLRPEFADWDAEARFELPGRARRRSEGLPVRRGADRRDQAVGVQGLRHRLHARAADRHLHGLERGRLRRLLQLRAAGAAAGSRARVRPRRPRLRDELVTLAHGAGGKATRAPRRGAVPRGARQPAARRRSATPRCSTLTASRLAFTTDSYVVKPLFFPGGDIGELAVNGTVNDLAVAGARPLALSAGFVIEEGFPVADLRRDRRVDGARRARRPASPVVDRRHEGRRARQAPTALYVTTAGIGVVAAGVELGPQRVRPGDRVLVSGTIGDHGMAVMVARGDLAARGRPRERHRRRCTSSPPALLELGAGAALDARPDPRRPRDRAQRARRSDAGSPSRSTRRRCPSGRRSSAPARSSASTRSTSPTRASSSPSSPPDAADAALALLRSHPLGADAAIVGEVARRARRASSCSRPRSAAAASSTCSSATRCRGSADTSRTRPGRPG